MIPLLKPLILPLVFVVGAAVAAHRYLNADGFFLNLATEVVGILITLCYVEWMLDQHEKTRWKSTDERIASRLQVLLNATISGLRSGLGFGPEILSQDIAATCDPYMVHKELVRVAEHVLAPEARSRVLALDRKGWSALAQHLRNAHNGIAAFLSAFQSRLTPDQISTLLDLQEALTSSLTSYTIFPDIMGVPLEELPRAKTPPVVLQRDGCESCARDLQRICALVKQLSDSVDVK